MRQTIKSNVQYYAQSFRSRPALSITALAVFFLASGLGSVLVALHA